MNQPIINKFVVSKRCLQSYPCRHDIKIYYSDGFVDKQKAVLLPIIIGIYVYLNKKSPSWLKAHSQYLFKGMM